MSVSARNQLSGVISAVADGAVNDEVELTLNGGAKIVAVVTHASKQTSYGVNERQRSRRVNQSTLGYFGFRRLWFSIFCSQPIRR